MTDSQSEMDIHNYIIVRSSREAIMSADNGIYIAKFPEGYRVAYAAAIENLTTHPEGSDERKNVLREYFGESPIIDSIEEAVSYAKELEKKYEYLEYGVVILFNEFESWGNKFKVFSNINACVVDPKGLDEKSFVDVEVEDGEYVIIPPNSFALTYSMEEITVPRDITGIVLSKSTYARTGLICLATPLEAGWKGFVTLEFSNTTPLPMKLYAGEGCCQVLWFKGDRNCLVSYADRDGKYQNQKAEVTLPRI